MRIQLWLRGAAAVAVIGLMATGSAAQARDLSCARRGGHLTVPLRIADHQTAAGFGSEPMSPTTVTSDQIKWSGPENEHGYRPTYVFDRNTGTLTRMTPMLFSNGLTSMWPAIFDCAGQPEKVE